MAEVRYKKAVAGEPGNTGDREPHSSPPEVGIWACRVEGFQESPGAGVAFPPGQANLPAFHPVVWQF